MQRFGAATQAWFSRSFAAPTRVQRDGWPVIADGRHALLVAPTGTGKTLAAFLWAIDRLMRSPAAGGGTRIVYVSPLKALVHDIDRNLRAPLHGIAAAAAELGLDLRLPRVALRTGDTSAAERRRQLREPGDILVTTPESLYLMLTSSAREGLRAVDTLIVDEVHALAPSKRGAHLALSLERLCGLAGEPQRIGLSATAQPLAEIARWLGGDRPVEVVDAAEPPAIDLGIVVPVEDMTRPDAGRERPAEDERPGERGIWPAIHPRLLELIGQHRTTIVFVNSRGLCERLARRLNELAGTELCRAHHGSLAQAERRDIEAALAQGRIAAIVATSSLELGIDMEAVDLVVLVESPNSTASGLQRVGRAGHGVGRTSIGRIFPKHRGDLLEATVVAERMRRGQVEATAIPQNPLDVLAQQVVAAVAADAWPVDELAARFRRAAPFAALPDAAFLGVIDMLSGRYPSTAFSELAPRLVWDRERDLLTPRRGARLIALVSGGTIPDRGTYPVQLGEDGPRVGELDEEMVHETLPGQTFALGATTWRIERVTRDRVIVSPAPGESGKLPFWRGDGPGRPLELGRGIGALVRELGGLEAEAARARLAAGGLDELAATNLLAYLAEQRAATGTLPTDRAITVERFRDEIGDWRVCILTPFGARVHAPWAIALEGRLQADTGMPVQTMWSDDGIALRFADADELPEPDALLLDPDQVDERLVERLGATSMFAAAFRENAARALLLPRRRPGERTPLWLQRLRSQQLLSVAQEFPSFPIIVETYRTCLRDVFDLPALRQLMTEVRDRTIAVDAVDTAGPSPFARSLMFDYVAAYLYEGDLPVAERRAQALALDRQLLRELLGEEELRDLLDPEAVAEVAAELQGLDPERRARDADELHDLLRRVGDLELAEIAARTAAEPAPLLAELARSGRAVEVSVGGARRWIAADDAALYRDALGTELPAGLPERLLAPVPDALDQLLLRHARHRPPFVAAEVAGRYRLDGGAVAAKLADLERAGSLVRGGQRRDAIEYCHPEVLRRMKRRSLARLRSEVAPVEAPAFARFLVGWHGLDAPRAGRARLEEAIARLEGVPLPYSDLEQAILPARVERFDPRELDELGAQGWLVWVGHGALGTRDGRIALYRRTHVGAWLAGESGQGQGPVLGEVERALEAHLERAGASFLVELQGACPAADRARIEDALWNLVWAGLITNDTLQPLRALARRGSRTPASRGRVLTTPGRWSLVRQLAAPVQPTERAHRLALALLDRHGVVSREVAAAEALPAGYPPVHAVLRAMEDAGKVRRGYFVDGLGGMQFAHPGAVEQLRARSSGRAREAQVLAASDPASPWGAALPWPGRADEGAAGARRAAGAVVVLCAGEPVLWLDRGGRRALSFPAAQAPEALASAARALAGRTRHGRGRRRFLRIETIDGQPARTSPLAAALQAAGFYADLRGLVAEPTTT